MLEYINQQSLMWPTPGFHVDGIELGEREACTWVTYPMEPHDFAQHYERSPITAASALSDKMPAACRP
jgi:hypothetical protein